MGFRAATRLVLQECGGHSSDKVDSLVLHLRTREHRLAHPRLNLTKWRNSSSVLWLQRRGDAGDASGCRLWNPQDKGGATFLTDELADHGSLRSCRATLSMLFLFKWWCSNHTTYWCIGSRFSTCRSNDADTAHTWKSTRMLLCSCVTAGLQIELVLGAEAAKLKRRSENTAQRSASLYHVAGVQGASSR
eukprot:6201848-Pleurochrysis_carterae.AAC.4